MALGRQLAFGSLGLVLCAFSRPALAQTTQRHWYGSEILISDAASVSVVAFGFGLGAPRGNGVVGLGVIGYELVPPVIHLTHGRWGMAPASLSLRVFVPALGLLVGSAAGHCPPEGDEDTGGGLLICDRNSAALGALGGAVLVTAIDSLLFSSERRPTDFTQSEYSARIGFAPLLSADGKHAEIRAYASF